MGIRARDASDGGTWTQRRDRQAGLGQGRIVVAPPFTAPVALPRFGAAEAPRARKTVPMAPIDTRLKLSALWLFVLLNIIFRDLHQFAMKSSLEMFLSGTYHGVEITEELMLFGGVLAQVPISMVLVSVLVAPRICRPVTLVAAVATAATLLSSAPEDLDDVFHLVVELGALFAIAVTAWVWAWPGDGRPAAGAQSPAR
ncbi:MAG: DUF6326 family protein [Pseudomonadota bacterium]